MDESGQVVQQMEDPDEIYRFTSEYEGICGFRDDFAYWQNNDYNHTSAKPLWIDPYDKDYHHIIFDDNYRPHHTDSIVDIHERGVDGKWTTLDNSQLHKYDDLCLVQVDLLAAINNENYYVEKVRDCEANFDRKLGKY